MPDIRRSTGIVGWCDRGAGVGRAVFVERRFAGVAIRPAGHGVIVLAGVVVKSVAAMIVAGVIVPPMIVAASIGAAIAAGPVGAALVALFRLLVLELARCVAQQPFAVGDRDAVIIGVDFAEGQETVPVSAILDERRLQRRFDACYLCEIDVSFERPSAGDFDVKFFQLPSVHHRDPGLFRVGGVDQHDLCHRR